MQPAAWNSGCRARHCPGAMPLFILKMARLFFWLYSTKNAGAGCHGQVKECKRIVKRNPAGETGLRSGINHCIRMITLNKV